MPNNLEILLSELNDLYKNIRDSRKKILSIIKEGQDSPSIEIKNMIIGNETFSKIMNILGLGNDLILKLNKSLKNNLFYEEKKLFDEIRNFFLLNYENIDLVVYRLNKHKNILEGFAGNIDFSTNISLKDCDTYYYVNEKESLKEENLDKFIYDTSIGFGGIGAINIKTKNDTYILSFQNKNSLQKNNSSLLNDLLKIDYLFSKSLITTLIHNKIEFIEAKYKDELTGLLNKAYIDSIPKHILYSALFIDIDKFKYINDTYGHTAGDEILKELASILKDSVKPKDKVCRRSGDEFILLLPTNNPSEVDTVETRIKDKLEKKSFKYKNIHTLKGEEFTISVSIGRNTKGYDSLQDIIDAAELIMYADKGASGLIHRMINDVESLSETEKTEFYKTLIYHLDYEQKKKLLEIIKENCSDEEKKACIKDLIDTITDKKIIKKIISIAENRLKNM